jgi:hypothetical protein
MFSNSKINMCLFIFVIIFFIYFIIKLTPIVEGNLEMQSVCPDPVYASDPTSNVVTNLMINNFMDYMDTRLQQANLDLDVVNTLIVGSTFNIIIDPSNIADVSSNNNLPPPKITMNSKNPPNYGIVFKLPKGRQGNKGQPGKNGLKGPTGPTGPTGPDGETGKRLVML